MTTVEFANVGGSTDGFTATIINGTRLKIQAWDSDAANGGAGATWSGEAITLADYDYNDSVEYYVQTDSGEYSSVKVMTANGNLLLDVEAGLTWHSSYEDAGSVGDMDISLLTKDAAAGNREIAIDQFTFSGDGSSTGTFSGATGAAFPLSVGDYLKADEPNKLAKVTRIKKSGNDYVVTCHRPILSGLSPNDVVAFKSYENGAEVYRMFILDKTVMTDQSIQDCLTAFNSGGVKSALVDKDVIDFRYIVDSFGSFESGNILNKNELTQVAKERQNVS